MLHVQVACLLTRLVAQCPWDFLVVHLGPQTSGLLHVAAVSHLLTAWRAQDRGTPQKQEVDVTRPIQGFTFSIDAV